MNNDRERTYAVVGLGYVGLPVAVALARVFDRVIGFDIDAERVAELAAGLDRTDEVDGQELRESRVRFTARPDELARADFVIVAVPTPVDVNNRPDLSVLRAASELVGTYLKPGAIVVYESTVYPGVTEEVCAPILARASGLDRRQFRVGYSPERINPGDRQHTLERVVKVVSGQDDQTLDEVAEVYGRIALAGVHRASSIKVAEAAKVIENTQRDLNIALMNELSMLFNRLGVSTRDVLEAAETKWNFLPFRPGLVGGHCIGVDPYYLTAKAEQVGLHPEVILAGRRTNDSMGSYVAREAIRLMACEKGLVGRARVGVLGITFKEDVPDIRNSRVPDILRELHAHGVSTLVHDPRADAAQVEEEHGVVLSDWGDLIDLDAVILAVPHRAYLELGAGELVAKLGPRAPIIDVKSALDPVEIGDEHPYWSL